MEGEKPIIQYYQDFDRFDCHVSIGFYQRAYKWGKRQLKEFIKTIESCNHSYNIGTITTLVISDEPAQVIDGQQRLLSTLLLLLALRSSIKTVENYDKDSDLNQRLLTIESLIRSGDGHIRITTENKNDQLSIDEIFSENSFNNLPSKNIQNAFLYFQNYFSSFKKEDFINFWKKLNFIKANFLITHEKSEAYSCFVALNSFGLKVEPGDLIPSIISPYIDNYVINEEIKEKFRNAIIDLHGNLAGGEKIQLLIRFINIENGRRSLQYSQEDALELIRNFFEREKLNTEKVLTNFLKFYNYDKLLKSSSLKTNEDLQYEIQISNEIDRYDLYLLDDILYNDTEIIKNLSSSEKAVLLRIWEFFIFNYLIKARSGGGGIHEFISSGIIAESIDKFNQLPDKDRQNFISVFKSHCFSKLDIKKEDFISFYSNFNIYKNFGKLFLKRVNDVLSEEIIKDFSFSIEHILPQAGNRDNPLLHTLGNLTILTQKWNSSLGNKDFSDKKEKILESQYKLNQYFKEIEVWNDDSIINRSSLLLDQLYEYYIKL